MLVLLFGNVLAGQAAPQVEPDKKFPELQAEHAVALLQRVHDDRHAVERCQGRGGRENRGM